MIEQLSLLRKATRYMSKTKVYDNDSLSRGMFLEELHEMKKATKFILPSGGLFMDNDDLPFEMKLPYPNVLLEFELDPDDLNPEADTHCMVYASENPVFGVIDVRIWLGNRRGEWQEAVFRTEIPMLRTNENDKIEDFIELHCVWAMPDGMTDTDERSISYFATRCLLNFLLFLDMRNISAHLKFKNKPKKGEKLSAHLHDSYHVLVLTHHKTGAKSELTCERIARSPRQHWRCGHHRSKRFSQERIWIAPTIVNKGWKGKVSKDYEVLH